MRTFILGVGAQKTGSTWLFKQLVKSERFCKGFSKEYHLFDALHLGNMESSRKNIERRIRNYPFQGGESFVEYSKKKMLGFYEDKKNYFDYFDSILTEEDSFTTDITPSYAGLSSDVFSEIKDQFGRRGIALKVVFVMREPISRLESAVKMDYRRNNTLHETTNKEMTSRLYKAINSASDMLRSDYINICSNLDRVFSKEEVFYGFYESWFSHEEIERLARFLDLPLQLFESEKIINSSAKSFRYSPDDMSRFKEKVRDRYQFVEDRFGFDLALWNKVTDKLIDPSI